MFLFGILCHFPELNKRFAWHLPDNNDARPAIIKDMITAGPAISLATNPDTTYMPVPTQLPTPSEVKSIVVKHRASFVTVIDFLLTSWTASIGRVL